MGLDDSILTINRISEAGPPDAYWPVVFLAGCNLRCPYCINSALVVPPPDIKHIPMDEVVRTLDAWGEEGVMVSGGEPLAHPDIIKIVAMLGQSHKVGISTNGTRPFVLQELLSSGLVNYVALDFKYSPRHVDCEKKLKIIGGEPMFGYQLFGSLGRVGTWRASCPTTTSSEVRITLYPPLVDEFDVRDAALEACLSHSRLVLQQYRSNRMFDGRVNDVLPYPDEEVERLKAVAEEVAKGKLQVEVRWP